jgi:tetratricopeptide (TPR) repeat protein
VAQGEEDKTAQTAHRSAADRLQAQRTAKAAAKAARRGTAPIVPTRVTRGVSNARLWYEDRRTYVWGAVAAIGLIALGWIGIKGYLGRGQHEAAELLRLAVATANAPILEAEAEAPEGEAPDESYASVQARATQARERFHKVAQQFGNSSAAAWARVGEANAASELSKYDEAQKDYDRVAADDAASGFLRWRALEGSGYALEAQKKYAEAAKRFEEIAKLDDGAYRPAADFQRARMHIALHEPQKAADLLQALVKAERARPPGEGGRFDSLLSDAETLLTELSVELNAPKLRTDIPPATASGASPGGATTAAGGGQRISPEILEALRKQLESGKADEGLSKEVVDALDQQEPSPGEEPAGNAVDVPAKPEKSK